MNQTVFTWQNIHECTEIDNPSNDTIVNSADFSLCSNSHNHLDRFIASVLILTKNFNSTVVIDIDSSARVLSDLTDSRTAFTDDVANLVGVDLQRNHARRIFRGNLTRFLEDRIHLT